MVQSQNGYTWYTCTSANACVKFMRTSGFTAPILTIPNSPSTTYRVGWYYPPRYPASIVFGHGFRFEYDASNNQSFEVLASQAQRVPCPTGPEWTLETTPAGRFVCFGLGRAIFTYEGLHYDLAPVGGPLSGSRQHAFVLTQVDHLTSTPPSGAVQLTPSE